MAGHKGLATGEIRDRGTEPERKEVMHTNRSEFTFSGKTAKLVMGGSARKSAGTLKRRLASTWKGEDQGPTPQKRKE